MSLIELECAKTCPFGKHCGEQVINNSTECITSILSQTGAKSVSGDYGQATAVTAEGEKIKISDGEIISP